MVMLTVLLHSCSDSKPPIPFDKMKSIMMDIHIAEVSAVLDDSTKNLGKPKDYDKLSEQYAGIFAHYDITQVIFKKAVDWYFTHPQMFDSIYKMMIEEVDSLEKNVHLDKDAGVSNDDKVAIPDSLKDEMDQEKASMQEIPKPLMPDQPSSAPQKTRPELMKKPENENY